MKKRPILLEATGLTVVRGGVRVLEVPSFVLRENEVLALIGPNGAGKSTLLLALACLIPLASGAVSFRGSSIVTGREVLSHRRSLAMVFQEPLLFDSSVFENVSTGLRIRGIGKKSLQERVEETLDLFRISHLSGRSARRLSGGEAQRTSLARAFAIRPEVILLDEPFSALDPPTRSALMDDLERILKQTGTAAIIATHDQMEAVRLADTMAVLSDGRIVQAGPPSEVISRPSDEFVASFVGMENVVEGTVDACAEGTMTIRVGTHLVEMQGEAPVGETALFCIRPEHITVTTSSLKGGTSARNMYPAKIRNIVSMGAYEKLLLDCGFPLVAYLTHQSLRDLHLEPGAEVFASFKATSVHVIRTGEAHQ